MRIRRIWGLGAAAILVFFGQVARIAAQAPERESKGAQAKATSEAAPPKEESSVTEHAVRVGGQTVPYKATAATILLKDEKGDANASLFYMAYNRSDVKDLSQRPLAFLYNGGPGSSSIWLHMGAFGPKRVVTTDAEATPPPPYGLVDNANSLLDKADLVFIDPVGTGFSRAVGKAEDKDFWGVDEDVKSLAQFIGTYVSRNNRWNSPKFLIGESYGTFRSVALVKQFGNDLDRRIQVSQLGRKRMPQQVRTELNHIAVERAQDETMKKKPNKRIQHVQAKAAAIPLQDVPIRRSLIIFYTHVGNQGTAPLLTLKANQRDQVTLGILIDEIVLALVPSFRHQPK